MGEDCRTRCRARLPARYLDGWPGTRYTSTVGREAIRAVFEQMPEHAPLPFEPEPPLPTIRYGDLALTSACAADGTGGRVQVVRHRPDGTWLRVIDRPELPPEG